MPNATKSLPLDVPLNGLLEVVFDVMVSEFRGEMRRSEFSDLRPVHGCVFRHVRKPGLRLTEIAERGNRTKQSVGEVVDDLVERGYVERIPDPDDRRAKLIRMTERGEEAQVYGFGILERIEKRWEERYGTERIADFREILETLTAGEAAYAFPEPAQAGT
ncbi:MAG TPA: MarR family transcriptional regulator [Solirubrobacterales bacterium]